MRKILAIIAVALPLAGCQTWGPTWSEVTGSRHYKTQLYRMPAIITRVDGTSPLSDGPVGTIKIEPGKRTLELQGVPPTIGWQPTTQTYVLDAEPCRRYWVNAQFENELMPSRWAPVIDFVEPIAGCKAPPAK